MDTSIATRYGNQVRVRVCGLCWRDGNLLMVNHRGLTDGDFWAPPGGGLEFQESVEACLKKEFREETGVDIEQGRFLFACEFMSGPLHAIELFFEVFIVAGEPVKGDDPELAIIEDARFMSADDIGDIPPEHIHGIFRHVPSPAGLKSLNGFFRI